MAWTSRPLRQLHPGIALIEHRSAPGEAAKIAAETAHLVLPDERNQARHLANVARLVLLRDEGGWWSDYDLIPLVPFTNLPMNATAAHWLGMRCNCWMAFEAGHPALTLALDLIVAAADGPPTYSTQVSGERILDAACNDDVARMQLCLDSNGLVNTAAEPWAIHLGGSLRGV